MKTNLSQTIGNVLNNPSVRCTGNIRRFSRIFVAAAVLLSGTINILRADFVPGAGGSIPVIVPFEALPNQIGGLRAYQSDRENIVFGNGTRAVIDLLFPAPSTYGATGYRLQRSGNGTSSWEDQPWYDGTLQTSSASQDNFSFNPDGSFHYRLFVQGGPKAGYVSNVVWLPISMIDTRFAGWGMDQSMFITGIMSPWVGSGMTASFHVRKLSDDSVVEGGLSYQWYRMNPVTSEMVPIPDATGLTYVTTAADVGGYGLYCRATGNETTAGGFTQIGSLMAVMVPNKSFASNVSRTGFRLNLYKSVSSLTPPDLELGYWDGATTVYPPITSVTPLPGNASFDIAVTIPGGVTSLWLTNTSDVWGLGEEMSFGPEMPPYFMRQLRITLPALGFSAWIASIPGVPVDRREPLQRNGPLDLQNLTAYAMGLDPMTAVSADLPQVSSLDPATGIIHFMYRRAKNLSDVTLRPRISTDLASWANANILSVTIMESGANWERVNALIQHTPGAKTGFVTLAAESVP